MNTIETIKIIASSVDGMLFRRPLPGYHIDAIAEFEPADADEAMAHFERLRDYISIIGGRPAKSSGIPSAHDHCATYELDDLRVCITVTGGSYSNPLLGVSAQAI